MKTLIVDCMGVGHYLKHSMKNLASDGNPTGIIYGFIDHLKTWSELFHPTHFCFAWDSHQSHRRRKYTKYKESRVDESNKTPEEILENELLRTQMNELKSILPSLGFNNSWGFNGYEADDIIASICENNPGRKIIMSMDGDLFQLLSKDVLMWDFRKRKKFTVDDFFVKWGIPAKDWWKVKKIAGCSADDVPNVPGVKETTAVKYLKGTLPHHHKTYQAILSHSQLIADNEILVRLPFPGTPACIIEEDKVSIGAFWRLCEQYEFNSFLHEIEEWTELLRMT